TPLKSKVMAEDIKLNEVKTGLLSHIIGVDENGTTVATLGREFLNSFAAAQRIVDCDLDNLLPGEYYISGNLRNAPSSEDWFFVKVIGVGDLLQYATSVTSDTLWRRVKMNGAWRVWKSINFVTSV
ncbi:pyocin knob domain-containing protein, partial [Bacteroides clarus]